MSRAIIIVDHGSTREAANATLHDLADLLQSMTEDKVYAAHVDLAEPTIAQAFDRAVGDGADYIFVFPYFLSAGRHSREEIPRKCEEAAAKHNSVNWHCTGPIGVDPMLCELIPRRTQQCESNNYDCPQCPFRYHNLCGKEPG